MGLESTYICVDCSEFQRNGDMSPTRLQAEKDAVNLVSQVKLRSHPENNVGLIAVSEDCKVLSTLTQDQSKLYMKLHQLRPNGYASFSTAIKIAALALKHRPSKNHRPRIVIFVGSPVTDSAEDLTKLAKKLRKEKMGVDAILYGEMEDLEGNEAKLKALIDTLNGPEGTGNHLVVVSGGSSLQEALGSSPVCRNEDGSGPAIGMGGALGGADFDPNDDPELAMALRVSLEEQRQRQEGAGGAGAAAAAAAGVGGGEAESGGGGGGGGGEGMEEEALDAPNPAPAPLPFEAMTEEEQLEFALRMSMQDGGGTDGGGAVKMEVDDAGASSSSAAPDISQLLTDPSTLQDLVRNLPGVNPNSPAIQEAVGAAKKEDKEKDKKEKKDAKKEDGDNN